MFVEVRPPPVRYTIAIAVVAAALGLAVLIPWKADPSHFSLFFIAVMLASWYGGLGAGLLATILSAFSLDYFFIAPTQSIHLDWRALLRLGVFTGVAAVTSYLTTARRRAELALRKAHDELDRRVRERTAELAQANDSLRAEIVERKRAEKELLRLQLDMGRVERLATMGRMSGSIAHELGTPLNSILGYTQLLAQEPLSERAKRRLAIIEGQIHRMGSIIQNYLSRARGPIPKARVDVNSLIRETLILLEPIFQQHGVEVKTALAEELPQPSGDELSLQRVLINLLDNAVDACENGGAILVTTAARSSLNGKETGVRIEVNDDGVGVAPELLPKIFDLFVTTKPPGEGTGLGLVICQEIVKAHGGTIEVKSELGRGTSVIIFLPADAAAPRASEEEARASSPPAKV
jgi:C4-dicarboxylate-specific signal transduction histidine kinase